MPSRDAGGQRSSSPGASVDFERSRSPERRAQGSGPRAADEVFVSTGGSKLRPAAITEKLRQVVGSVEALPVMVGLVCARLAREWTSDIIRDELRPHLGEEKEPHDLQDFLSWLEKEHEAAPPPKPKDPRPRLGFKEGDIVRLVGLERRPELNQCKVEVLRSNEPTQPGRIIVRHAGSQLAIRSENLQHLVTFPDPEKPAKASDTKNPVFEAAFAKLKAKAEAEARGELPAEKKKGREKDDLDARGGIGSSQPAGQARRERVMGTPVQTKEAVEEEPKKKEPIQFVAAEAWHEPPSRKVTVIDPRQKRPLDDSDDEDVGIPGVVRPRRPPGSQDGSSQGPPLSPVRKAAKATPEPVCSMPAAPRRGLAKTAGSPSFPSPGRPSVPLQNMTLVVSDDARQADRMQRELVEKRKAMEDGKRQMLEKLTKQMQICLARLQNTDLDDKAKERYQDMITTLKAQMSKIGNV